MKIRKHKKLIALLLLLLAIIIVCIGVDYHRYKNDEKSYLFKQKLSYNQNDAVKIGNIEVKLSKISYQQPDTGTGCSNYQSYFNIKPICFGPAFDGKKGITIEFSVKNETPNLLDISPYKFKLIGNTNLTYEELDIKSGQILAKSTIAGKYSSRFDPNYKGQYVFEVTHKAIRKTITINN